MRARPGQIPGDIIVTMLLLLLLLLLLLCRHQHLTIPALKVVP